MAKVEQAELDIEVSSQEEIGTAAKQIVEYAQGYKVWLFEGEMGAGKTTLTKAIAQVFGVMGMVNSPTFSIVNEYVDASEVVYYHFDFYRIKNEQEALDIGAEEYFYSGDHCFIEWSSKIPNLIPDQYLKIDVKITSPNSRSITCTKHG